MSGKWRTNYFKTIFLHFIFQSLSSSFVLEGFGIHRFDNFYNSFSSSQNFHSLLVVYDHSKEYPATPEVAMNILLKNNDKLAIVYDSRIYLNLSTGFRAPTGFVGSPRFSLPNLLSVFIPTTYKTLFQSLNNPKPTDISKSSSNVFNNWELVFVDEEFGFKNLFKSRRSFMSIPNKNVIIAKQPHTEIPDSNCSGILSLSIYIVNQLSIEEFGCWTSSSGSNGEYEKAFITDMKIAIKQHQLNFDLAQISVAVPQPWGLPKLDYKDHYAQLLTDQILPSYLILAAISSHLNATPVSNFYKGGYGSKIDKTNGYDGMVGAVEKSIADMGQEKSIEYEEWRSIEYSQVFTTNRVIFITPLPTKTVKSMTFLIQAFESHIWMALIFSYSLLVAAGIAAVTFKVKKVSIMHFLKMATVFLLPAIDQSAKPTKALQGDSKFRILMGLWMAVLIVLGSLYKTSMVSYLVQPTLTKPPETFQELVLSEFNINMGWLLNTFFIATLHEEGTSLALAMASRVKSVEFAECYDEVQMGKSVCTELDVVIKSNAMRLLIDRNGENLFRTSKESMRPRFISLLFSPYSLLKPIADQLLQNLLKGHIFEKWYRLGAIPQRRTGRKNAIGRAILANQNRSTTDRMQSMDVHELSNELVNIDTFIYPMIILGVGLGLAFFGFVLEKMYSLLTVSHVYPV